MAGTLTQLVSIPTSTVPLDGAYYEPEGGATAVSITPMAMYHLSEKWHIGGGVRYELILGDAADSPIVDDRGDTNQFMGGISAVYSWGAKTNTR